MSEKSLSVPQRGSSSQGFRLSAGPLLQAALAVTLSVLVFLVLIFAQSSAGGGARLQDRVFANWSVLVCALLACWALATIAVKWRQSGKRARCVGRGRADKAITGADDLIAKLRAAAETCGDSALADRAERLLGHARAAGDVSSAADFLQAERDGALLDLEASWLPVRVLLWSIPALGFIGTAMAIGQAARTFATLLIGHGAAAADIRNALLRTTASVGGAFETTVAALLMTILVMGLMMVAQQREKTLLDAIDDFCRVSLLPLLAPKVTSRGQGEDAFREALALLRQRVEQSHAAVTTVADGVSAAGAPVDTAAVREVLEELRENIHALRPSLDQLAANLRHHASGAKASAAAAD